KRVELPEAITSAEEQVYVPKSEELVASTKIQDKVGNVNRHIESNIAVKSKNRQIAEKPELGDQSDFLNSISEKLSGGERESPFILEGDIIHRTILHKVIPEYPDNVQKNAQIKIKFNVSAEGDVTDVILIKKADPILDQISVEAIQKWRFNSIEQDVQQTGFITFRYKIK
ncbi:MAG: TonB family protein, partial [Candidatus Cloacimonadota bacterium]|nr:TonB family protein [Candidatus Cloacimonadota bacterium]